MNKHEGLPIWVIWAMVILVLLVLVGVAQWVKQGIGQSTPESPTTFYEKPLDSAAVPNQSQPVESSNTKITQSTDTTVQRQAIPSEQPPLNWDSDVSWGASTKIIPDTELIYGRTGINFSITEFVPSGSYLQRYWEEVEGVNLSGIAIVDLVAQRTRIHPRLLLAALEHRSKWVTQSSPELVGDRPMQHDVVGAFGLYNQLRWAANQLNAGYYGFTELNENGFRITDGSWVEYDPAINAGTAAVQRWLGSHQGATYNGWMLDVSSIGFKQTYHNLFGDPFVNWLPPEPEFLQQPYLALPWSKGESWYFTGGPHGGWGNGSAWAALDFVSPSSMGGCGVSPDWVTAVADGIISYSNMGEVILDLDGDGYSGTGWAVLYQHIATQDRIPVGTPVSVGDRIGHPSCEGGYSTGTHLHIARLYNGRWISADKQPYFTMGGWTAFGNGYEYNGTLSYSGIIKTADIGRSNGNLILAE